MNETSGIFWDHIRNTKLAECQILENICMYNVHNIRKIGTRGKSDKINDEY